jgi:hypothetical protein
MARAFFVEREPTHLVPRAPRDLDTDRSRRIPDEQRTDGAARPSPLGLSQPTSIRTACPWSMVHGSARAVVTTCHKPDPGFNMRGLGHLTGPRFESAEVGLGGHNTNRPLTIADPAIDLG